MPCCPACDRQVASHDRFCAVCGAGLPGSCARCGNGLDAGARFCSACGHPVEPGERSAPAAADAGDRRQLTVLFCDLVGSTELAGRLDPEDWATSLAQYHRRATEIVDALDGHVAQYLGDGILAYFGWPRAHEDAAERAVRAGLELVRAIPALHAGEERLQVRVGIHTGLVIVGAIGAGSEMLALGGAPNVAARVQSLAEVGTVLLTDATLRLVAGAFVVENAGAHVLRGVGGPVRVHRALATSGARSRGFVTSGSRMTPFVGRERELALLHAQWARACDGDGQLVLVVGEAGIGKSRLVRHFREAAACAPDAWIECATSAYHRNTPFFAVVEMLRRLGAPPGASDTERLEALGHALARGGLAREEAIPLIAPLLGLDAPGAEPLDAATAEDRRRRLLASLVAWIQGVTCATPAIVVVEDLHWADPSTLDLLQLLAEEAAAARLLLVMTARPEFEPPWTPRTHHSRLPLGRLDRDEARTMVEGAVGPLARDLVDIVIERTDGVPLFLEELTRLVVESGQETDAQAIPATLSDSLMARLDRLGPAKEVAQVGAVIGRQFGYGLVRTVMPIADGDLEARLARLRDAGLVHVRGVPPDATYRFKHALVQDAAYESLLRSRRRSLHGAIAAALRDDPDTPPEILGRHSAEAGEHDAAVAAWQRAGELAAARGALGEAAGHYDAALDALRKVADGPDRVARELPLQVALGQALFARKGYGSPEVAEAFARARTLAAQHENPIQTLSVLVGLFVWALTRAELSAARDLADDMTAAATAIGHRAALVWAEWAQGAVRYACGEFDEAERTIVRAIESYHEDDHRGRPTDPGMSSLVYAALIAGRRGFADTARARMASAAALADRLGKTYSITFARSYACMLYAFLRDADTVATIAPQVETLARDSRFPVLEITGIIYGEWAAAMCGGTAASLPRMRDAVARYAGMGQRHVLGFYRSLLAEAEAAAGEIDAALATVAQALSGESERIDRPRLLCLQAALLERAGSIEPDAVVARYREAVALAREMAGRGDELQAALRLAGWLAAHGGASEARELLASLQASFGEGLDTADVRDARTLLDALAGTAARAASGA